MEIITSTRKEAEAYYRVKVRALIAEAMDLIKEEIAQKYPNAIIEQGSLVAQATILVSKQKDLPLILITDQSPKDNNP